MQESNLVDICQAVKLVQSDIDALYSSNSKRKFGKFIPEQFRVELNFDISEINSFESSDITKGVFRQTWVHEYFHLFQSLTMPKFSQICQIMRNKQKVDAGFLLYAIEDGASWKINSDGFIDFTDIIIDGSYSPPEFVGNEIERHYPIYEKVMKDWKLSNDEGISNLEILEGMAHVFSISDDPLDFNDDLGLKDNEIYTNAYQYFLDNGGYILEGNLNRVSFFTILCFFSFFSIQHTGKDSPRDIFVYFCRNWKQYYFKLRNKSDPSVVRKDIDLIIKSTGIVELETLKQNESAIEFFQMFYGLIEFMENETDELVFPVSNEFTSMNQFSFDHFNELSSSKLLLYFLRFSSMFIDWTDKIRHTGEINYHLGKSAVTIENDQDLMRFVQNFWFLINANAENPWCCPNHEYENRRGIILKCSHLESFSSICYDLTNRNLRDIVGIL